MATEADIRAYVGSIERSSLSDWTKHDCKVSLKKLYKWLNGGEEHPATKWIKTTLIRYDRKLPYDMLIQNEIKRMIDAAIDKRDKAIIALLWDIGARIGKTGQRRVRTVWSVDCLKDWIDEHPGKNNPKAPLWFKFTKKINWIQCNTVLLK